MSTVPNAVAADEERAIEFRPAFLRRVRIRGYKSIAFCDVTLEPLTILVGRNGAGKSNFLDALAFVRDAMETNIPEAVRRHGGWKSILSRFAQDGEVSFELEIALPPDGRDPLDLTPGEMNAVEYGFALREGPTGTPMLTRERFHSPGGDGIAACEYRLAGTFDERKSAASYEWDFNHPEVDCSAVPHPHPDRLWLGSFAEQPFAATTAGLRFMRSYNFDPRVIRPPQKREPETLLTANGQNLASVIESVEALDRNAIRRVRDYLRAIDRSIDTFWVARDGEYETIRFRYLPVGTNPGLELDAVGMADGVLRALGCFVAVFQSKKKYGAPSLVGIDELETSLHPRAMYVLESAFRESILRTQILIATHSSKLLDCPDVRLEEVRVVSMIDGETTIGPLDDGSVEIIRRGWSSLGKLHHEQQLERDPVVPRKATGERGLHSTPKESVR